MKILKIKPNDNLFFGDGKRFDKGESTWLHSKLMPYPSVFNGAIASLMLSLNQSRRTLYIDTVKNKDNTENDPRNFLEIGKIYLYNEENEDIYMPAPLDLFVDKRGRCQYGVFRKMNSNYTSSLKELEYFLFSQNKSFERVDAMFIKRTDFYNAYMATEGSIGFLKKSDIIACTYKVGIQKDEKTGNSKEDHLYRIDLTEFKDNEWSYLVEYHIEDEWWEGNDIKGLGVGYLKLGGENKSCKYYDVSSEDLMIDYSKIYEGEKTKFIKLYFISPVIFDSFSYKPDMGDSEIQFVGATTSKPYSIGGFDMKKKSPKNMYKAVPEGSVYVLKSDSFQHKTLGQIKEEIYELLKKNCREDKRLFKEGFGQFEVVRLSSEQLKGE